MTTPSEPHVVCFDLGGVLVRICRSWEEGCAAARIDPDRGWRPAGSDGVHHELVDAYTIGAVDDERFFAMLQESAGGGYSAADFRRIHEAWILGLYPGVEALIEELRSAEVKTACLSNTNAAHWRQMADWPILAALDHRFASHLLRCAKPAAEMYTTFSGALKVNPERILFFDDLAENVEAARELGWDAVHIDHTGDTAFQIRCSLTARGVVLRSD